MKRAQLVAGAVVSLASGCGASDVAEFVRDPSPGRIAFYLAVVPVLWIAQEILGEVLVSLLPAWMKTRRAVWTAVAVAAALTAGAVVYWSTSAPR